MSPRIELLSVLVPLTLSAAPATWLMWLAVVRPRLPETLTGPRTRAFRSLNVKLRTEATLRAPVKSLPALDSVTLWVAPTATLVVPCTCKAPLWVMAPSACKLKLPWTLEAPNCSAPALRRLT